MPGNRRAGVLFLKIDGIQHDVMGNWTYNLGQPKREAIVGPDRVQGYKETPQVAYLEGEITDAGELDVAKLLNLTDTTTTLELANGKTIVHRNGWYAGDGNIGTENANIQIRIEALSAEET